MASLSRALLTLVCAALVPAQEPVAIRVDTASGEGPFRPISAYFGYDEPNYTYMKHGPKLIAELAAMSPVPVYIRAHHLLCSGDGTAALKWGSTNAYTEHAAGRPVYDWTIVDRIFDTYVKAKAKPFVEIGFMPEALSVKPQPYATRWRQKDSGDGWTYPPKDYGKWGELVYQWVRHSVARHGAGEVLTWYWELWNEPDISYWRGRACRWCRWAGRRRYVALNPASMFRSCGKWPLLERYDEATGRSPRTKPGRFWRGPSTACWRQWAPTDGLMPSR
jgi:xylan 1,4-beta-xylosidase